MAHTKVTKNGTQNTGTANTFSYSGSFDVFKASEVEVELDNIALTFTTSTINESASPREYTVDYDNKTVHVGGANLVSSNTVTIQPVTDMGAPTPRATYEPGSSVTSADLNNNQLQLMRKVMEYEQQLMSSRGATMTGNLELGQNVDLIFEGDTDNAYETTLTVADPTSDKTITLPDTTGTVVTTGDTGTVTGTMIASRTITADRIAGNSITASELNNSCVEVNELANNAVATAKIQDAAVTTAKITDANVTTAKIANDAVTADKLAHTSVTAGTYTATDLTVDAQGRITAASSGTIGTSEIAADAIDGTKIADDSIDSEHYVDASIDTAHIADSQITSAKIADGTIVAGDLASDSVTTAKIVDQNVTTAKLASNAVTTATIMGSAVTTAKIADDAVTTVKIADANVTTDKIAGSNVTDAKLASNSVTTSKITDANVTTVKIADDAISIAKIGCEQTTISDSDSHIPTSGAVVDYVAAQIAPIGGLEVIADEDNFPTSQPGAGVVISISDAAGIVVQDGTGGTVAGRSTTARTAGNGSDNVIIDNFPSSLYGETLATGVGLMVSSTGSSNTYNYHKILAAETDVKQLSDDINDFNARYRVGSSNPSSSLDSGDLFFNTGSGKLLVYNGTNSAWEEAQSIGQYFINTISSYSGTGGNSASFNGSAYRFVLSNPGTVAEQHIVSINGVIQKPNSGTSQPSEGFAIDGSSIIFSSAPATGAGFFIITIGSTVNIGTPSDGTVSTSKLASGAVTTAKIADDAVTAAKLASDAVVTASIVDANVTTAKIADDAVTSAKIASNSVTNDSINNDSIHGDKLTTQTISLAKLVHGTSSQDGKFLRANNGADPTFETVNTDLVSDTSPQLGGALSTNGHNISFGDGDGGNGALNRLMLGASNDLQLYHDGSDSQLINNTNRTMFRSAEIHFNNVGNTANMAKFISTGAVELYNAGSKKFETTSGGATVTGVLALAASSGNNPTINNADGGNGNNMYFNTGGSARLIIQSDGHTRPAANNTYDLGTSSDRWRNVYTNDLHLSNKGHTNDVDQTWGDWTIQEGESDLFLKNNRSGKKYKFNLTEVS